MPAIAHSFARFLPDKVVTNDDLAKTIDTSDEWIQKRTGIKERRFVEEPTTTSDLAVGAAKVSLKAHPDIKPDAIIAATLSPDYDFPGIGVLMQSKMELGTIPAFDVRNQCSGFLYGIELADALVSQGKYQHVLVAGAEVHSTGLDLTTRGRDIAVLFGDGAGTCIVSSEEAFSKLDSSNTKGRFEIMDSELHGDGAHASELWCEHIGSAHFPTRLTQDLLDEAKVFPYMNGRMVFENAVKRMIQVSVSLLEKSKITPDQIKLILPHQANLRINSMVAKELGLKEDQVFNTIQKYGNTTAATIPIGFSHAIEEVEFSAGDYILSCAFGSGFTWGAVLFRHI